MTFGDAAQRQIRRLNIPETIAVDRAIVAIQTDPGIGTEVPGNAPWREYREEGASTRVIYYATTLGTQIVVAYIEA
ncbi:hypothetical protein [Streptomyces sp. NPDC059788]|uniref:hypothetical protein n=1 Tax=Streptomyces sp. NPDC059788 TaxID=3346948 RepID=UPI00364918B2